MTRYVVTLDNGTRWELSARSVAEAVERGEDSGRRWGAGGRVQVVQTLAQYVEGERAQLVRDLDALGAVVVGAVTL